MAAVAASETEVGAVARFADSLGQAAESQMREGVEALRRQCREALAAGLAEAWALATRRLQEAQAGAWVDVDALLAAGEQGLASGGAGSAREALAVGVGRLLDRGHKEARAKAMEEATKVVAAAVADLGSAKALERHTKRLHESQEQLQRELAKAQGLEGCRRVRPRGWERAGCAHEEQLQRGPTQGSEEEEARTEESLAVAAASEQAEEQGPEAALDVGLLFPGEASRHVGMLRDVQHIPAVGEMLKVAEAVLGWDLLPTCLEGPASKLVEFSEPAMFVAGMAGLETLRLEQPEVAQRFQVCAGIGVGELVALCAAGVFSFADGLRLAAARGKALREAAAACPLASLYVWGLNKSLLRKLCRRAQRKEGGGSVSQIGQELFPLYFICAGTRAATLHLQDLCEKRGATCTLILGEAANTPLMSPAKDELARNLEELLPKMRPPKQSVFMNATAELATPGTEPRELAELIARQVTSPVLWELSVRSMISAGVKEYYEIGPNKFLTFFMQHIDKEAWSSTSNVEV